MKNTPDTTPPGRGPWEVRTTGNGWEESTIADTRDAALAAVQEQDEYPHVRILYVSNWETGERWDMPGWFAWRDHEPQVVDA